jgi:hypothetical protein
MRVVRIAEEIAKADYPSLNHGSIKPGALISARRPWVLSTFSWKNPDTITIIA